MLRNRATDDTYLVILFTLYRREDVEEDGSLKPAALEASRQQRAAGGLNTEEKKDEEGEGKDEQQDYEEARRRFGDLDVAKESAKDGDDDVD